MSEKPNEIEKSSWDEVQKSREDLKLNIWKSLWDIKKSLVLITSFDEKDVKTIEKWIKTLELRINMLNDQFLSKVEPKLSTISSNLTFSNISLDNQFRWKIVDIFDENSPTSILNWLN